MSLPLMHWHWSPRPSSAFCDLSLPWICHVPAIQALRSQAARTRRYVHLQAFSLHSLNYSCEDRIRAAGCNALSPDMPLRNPSSGHSSLRVGNAVSQFGRWDVSFSLAHILNWVWKDAVQQMSQRLLVQGCASVGGPHPLAKMPFLRQKDQHNAAPCAQAHVDSILVPLQVLEPRSNLSGQSVLFHRGFGRN